MKCFFSPSRNFVKDILGCNKTLCCVHRHCAFFIDEVSAVIMALTVSHEQCKEGSGKKEVLNAVEYFC